MSKMLTAARLKQAMMSPSRAPSGSTTMPARKVLGTSKPTMPGFNRPKVAKLAARIKKAIGPAGASLPPTSPGLGAAMGQPGPGGMGGTQDPLAKAPAQPTGIPGAPKPAAVPGTPGATPGGPAKLDLAKAMGGSQAAPPPPTVPKPPAAGGAPPMAPPADMTAGSMEPPPPPEISLDEALAAPPPKRPLDGMPSLETLMQPTSPEYPPYSPNRFQSPETQRGMWDQAYNADPQGTLERARKRMGSAPIGKTEMMAKGAGLAVVDEEEEADKQKRIAQQAGLYGGAIGMPLGLAGGQYLYNGGGKQLSNMAGEIGRGAQQMGGNLMQQIRNMLAKAPPPQQLPATGGAMAPGAGLSKVASAFLDSLVEKAALATAYRPDVTTPQTKQTRPRTRVRDRFKRMSKLKLPLLDEAD